MNLIDAINTADRVAPVPDTVDEATREAWLRHYVALALAAHAAFRDLLPVPGASTPTEERGRPELGYAITIAVAATAAAVGLDTEADAVGLQLWALTPEAGNLNGEDVTWLIDRAKQLGINPADLYPRLAAADFRSPSTNTSNATS